MLARLQDFDDDERTGYGFWLRDNLWRAAARAEQSARRSCGPLHATQTQSPRKSNAILLYRSVFRIGVREEVDGFFEQV